MYSVLHVTDAQTAGDQLLQDKAAGTCYLALASVEVFMSGPGLYYNIFISEPGWKFSFQDQVFTAKSSFQDQVFTTTSSSQDQVFTANLHLKAWAVLCQDQVQVLQLRPWAWLEVLSQVQMFTTKYSFQTLKSSFQSQVLIFISEPELWKSFSQAQIFTTKSSFQSLGSGTPHVRTRSLLPKSCVRALALEVLFQTRSYCNIFISEPGLWKSFPRTRSLLQNLHVRAWTLKSSSRPGLYYNIFSSEPGPHIMSDQQQ